MSLKTKLKKVAALLPLRRTILLESVPDLSDNTKAVFDELLRRNFHKRYRLVWWLHKPEIPHPKQRGVIYVKARSLLAMYYAWTAKCLISCNDFQPSRRSGQVSLYLSHGTPIKDVRGIKYTLPPEMDYCLAASPSVTHLMAEQLEFPQEKVVPLGFPRNDVLTLLPKDIRSLLQTECKKVVVWYPTYRQHANGTNTASAHALPILHDAALAKALNETAKQENVLIVLKPHFAQDLRYIRELDLSNVRFIDDAFFTKNGITSYEFVGGCDALVTDYSSIYYDYTLCDRPVAVIWEDIEEYRRAPGFAVDLDVYLDGAEKLYTVQDYQEFIRRVAQGEDLLREQRRRVRDLTNVSCDGNNARRVVDFLIEKAELEE